MPRNRTGPRLLVAALAMTMVVAAVLAAETSTSTAAPARAVVSEPLETFRLAVWNQDLEWGSAQRGPDYWTRVPATSRSTARVEQITGRSPFAAYGGANVQNHIVWMWDGSRSASAQLRSRSFDAVPGRPYIANANASLGRGKAATFALEFYDARGRRLSVVPQRSRRAVVGRLTRMTVSATAPRGTTQARLLVTSDAATVGSSYWDSFSVDELRRPEGYIVPLGRQSAMFVPGHRVASTSNMTQRIVPGVKHGSTEASPDADPVYNGYRMGAPTHAAQMFGSVIQDDGIFKMWFQVKQGTEPWSVWYSESPDGITWGRGEKVLHDAQPGGVLLNPDTRDPAKRFLMFAVRGTMRMVPDRLPMPPVDVDYRTYSSPDGKTWSPMSSGRAINFRDIAVVSWDPLARQFVAMTKQASGLNRQLFVSTSKDFITWSTPRRALRTDDKDPASSDVYTTALFRSGEELVALPSLYTARFYEGIDGPMRPYLATSRNGVHYKRPDVREPSIPLGRVGSLDDGMITTANQPVVVGDRLRLYYGGWNAGHEEAGRSPRVYFAEWERERFAALRVTTDQGSVTTRTLRHSGQSLTVNASVPEGGSLSVAVLDAKTRTVVPGYEAGRSTSVTGDDLDHEVRWGDRTLGALRGRDVVLRFVATRDSELYAFTVS